MSLDLGLDHFMLEKELEQFEVWDQVEDLRVASFIEGKDLLRLELNLTCEEESGPTAILILLHSSLCLFTLGSEYSLKDLSYTESTLLADLLKEVHSHYPSSYLVAVDLRDHLI